MPVCASSGLPHYAAPQPSDWIRVAGNTKFEPGLQGALNRFRSPKCDTVKKSGR
jgi:hypothetical protein